MPLINCEMELDLSWPRYYIISEVSWTSRAVPDTDPVEFEVETATNSTTFQINNAKFYVPVGTLSINDNIKFLQNIKQGFKRTISWNKHKSERTTQPKNHNLDYLIGATYRNINRLFVLLFRNGINAPTTNFFDKYYTPLLEIKDFKVSIDNKLFFNHPVKTNKKGTKNLSKCQEMMTIQQEIYQIIFVNKNIINSLV